MIFCTCISASILNIQGMISIKQLGASSMQIVGKLNIIVLVALSMAFFGETFPIEVVVGTFFVLTGVAVFEYGEHSARAGQQMETIGSRKETYELVPTTIGHEERTRDEV